MSNRNNTKQPDKGRRAGFSNAGGFSLIELIIAMAILAFGMLAAASMQYSAIKNNTNGNIYTQASDVWYSDPTLINANEGPGGIYNRQWLIQALGTQARRITVRVEWTRLGDTRSVILESNTRGSGV